MIGPTWQIRFFVRRSLPWGMLVVFLVLGSPMGCEHTVKAPPAVTSMSPTTQRTFEFDASIPARESEFYGRCTALDGQIQSHKVFLTVNEVFRNLGAPDAVHVEQPPLAYLWAYRFRTEHTPLGGPLPLPNPKPRSEMVAIIYFYADKRAKFIGYSPLDGPWAEWLKVPGGADESEVLSLASAARENTVQPPATQPRFQFDASTPQRGDDFYQLCMELNLPMVEGGVFPTATKVLDRLGVPDSVRAQEQPLAYSWAYRFFDQNTGDEIVAIFNFDASDVTRVIGYIGVQYYDWSGWVKVPHVPNKANSDSGVKQRQ